MWPPWPCRPLLAQVRPRIVTHLALGASVASGAPLALMSRQGLARRDPGKGDGDALGERQGDWEADDGALRARGRNRPRSRLHACEREHLGAMARTDGSSCATVPRLRSRFL